MCLNLYIEAEYFLRENNANETYETANEATLNILPACNVDLGSN